MAYDFTAYYKQVYLKEKEKNIQLAIQAASKEAAVMELQKKRDRITGNPAIRLFSNVKRIPAKIKESRKLKLKEAVCKSDSVSVRQYERELELQKNPYLTWINEHEKPVQAVQELSLEEAEKSLVHVVFMQECGSRFSLKKIQKPYVLFVSDSGKKRARAESTLEQFFDNHKEAVLVYAAEDTAYERAVDGKNTPETGNASDKGNAPGVEIVRENPWFKPAYSPETLLAFFYPGSIFAVRKKAAEKISWLGSEDWKKNIYDFVLKLEESAGKTEGKFAFCDSILYHEKKEKEETRIWGYEEQFNAIKEAALRRRGCKGHMGEGNVPGIQHVCIENKDKISIVILSKDNPEMLERCIASIKEKTEYPEYEIIVVDNGSYETNRIKTEQLSKKYMFTFICEPMDFNFSVLCNLGAKEATGKYLLLLNDDVEVIEGEWLSRMAGQASVEGVGAVGAKLWYPESIKIQHAGITNLAIGPAHKLTGFTDDKRYYDGRNYFTFNYLAVTGACLMVKKELYDILGGLDETMPVAYNDVEFCFRLRKAGYRNVLRNDCILLHHESFSRGLDVQEREKEKRLLEERRRLYKKYPDYAGKDEYYSPWLYQDMPEYGCGGMPEYKCEEITKPVYANGLKKSAKQLGEQQLMVSLENIRRFAEEETAESIRKPVNTGKLEIFGWSVLRGADNCHYKRSIVLDHTDSKKIYTSELMPYIREDVENVFPMEIRIGLSGFAARLELKSLEKGNYRIGILYEDMLSDKVYYRMLEEYTEID